MNQPTYFKKLRALCRTMQKCEWRLTNDSLVGSIRATHTTFNGMRVCPLTFTEKIAFSKEKERGCADYLLSGMELGFTQAETLQIVMAADSPQISSEIKLRRILLKAARLTATARQLKTALNL